MKFDWHQLFELANELARQAESETEPQKREALRRTAISRAYYAVFCLSAAWLREHFPQVTLPESGDIHRGVIDFFEWHQEAEYKQVGVLLDSLRKRRNRADYASRLQDSKDVLARSLFDANRVLNALSGLETSNAA